MTSQSGLSRIQDTFEGLRAAGHLAFMPFVSCGDPDLATTAELIRELARQNVDLIEVGFPYSDPIADGPIIQESYTRALQHGIHVSEIFEQVGAVAKEEATPPLVAMVAYAIIFRCGVERFVEQARDAGFSGMIVPDLPGDEAAEFAQVASAAGLALVQLVAPTTPPQRAERILKSCSGFVYCISVAGITGVRDELPKELREQLQWLRSQTDLPLAVGFGISRPDQIETLRDVAHGVIVGSAIVRHLQRLPSEPEAIREIGEFAASMVRATHSS